MNIVQNVNYIFDFDGTIAELYINWGDLKKEIDMICRRFGLETDQKLNVKIDELKSKTDVINILKKFEQVNSEVSFCQKDNTIRFIQSLEEFYVVSNNLRSTILIVIEKLNLLNKCKKIIGIDDVTKSKPEIDGFLHLRNFLKYEKSIYVGNSDVDKIFAQNCKISFLHVEEIL